MKYGYLKLLIFKNEKTTLVNKILFSYIFLIIYNINGRSLNINCNW